jgi:hypothetical protein
MARRMHDDKAIVAANTGFDQRISKRMDFATIDHRLKSRLRHPSGRMHMDNHGIDLLRTTAADMSTLIHRKLICTPSPITLW